MWSGHCHTKEFAHNVTNLEVLVCSLLSSDLISEDLMICAKDRKYLKKRIRQVLSTYSYVEIFGVYGISVPSE